MNKHLWKILILIALINPILFITKSKLLLTTKRIPVSPLPLVFDSPKNFHYWAYTYKLDVTTNTGSKTVFLDNQYIAAYPRSSLIEALYFIIVAGSQIEPNVPETKRYLDEIMCHSSLKIYKFVPENERILKYSMTVSDQNNKILRQSEHLCK